MAMKEQEHMDIKTDNVDIVKIELFCYLEVVSTRIDKIMKLSNNIRVVNVLLNRNKISSNKKNQCIQNNPPYISNI